MVEACGIGVQHACHTVKLGRFSRRTGSGTRHQHMHLAQALHTGKRLGHRIGRQLPVIHIGKQKNGHQITPASSLSFAISSATDPTFTPALRPAGSTVLMTDRRGVTSTP